MPIAYEWDVETVDEHDDVVDHDHDDAVRPLLARHPLAPGERLVLVFNRIDRHGDLLDRAWAYVESGKLPNMFDNGHSVPRRFRRELALED